MAATGGVGRTAIELAKQLEAEVIATTRAADKVTSFSAAGADHVIVMSAEGIVAIVSEITGGHGVKLAFDSGIRSSPGSSALGLSLSAQMRCMGCMYDNQADHLGHETLAMGLLGPELVGAGAA